MEISIKGLDETAKRLREYPKSLVFAVSKALNDIGGQVKKAERQEMATVFDRPTPFTLNALEMLPANKRNLEVRVRLKVAPRLGEKHYLIPQIEGGSRDLKRSEKWLRGAGILPPGKYIAPARGAVLDNYGNMGPKMVQILSALKAFPETGYKMNVTARSKKTNKKPRNFFVAYKDGVAFGIFERRSGSATTWAQEIPVLIFISKPQYSRRLNFYNVAEATVYGNLNRSIRDALDYAAATVK
jgi:hypothetical protein